MEFSIKQVGPDKQKSECVVVTVTEDGKFSTAGEALNKAAKGALAAVVANGDMSGKAGATLMLHHVPGIAAARVLLAGLGKPADFSDKTGVEVLASVFKALQASAAKDATLFVANDFPGRDAEWVVHKAVIAGVESAYRPDSLKSSPANPSKLARITFGVNAKPSAGLNTALAQSVAIAHGMTLTKDLGNLPGNICTPTYLAAKALALARAHKSIKTTVLEEKDMQKLGMGSLLSVTRGSEQPAKLITLEYSGGKKGQKPVVLVGKGITFDSGGISLKPGAEMDEMKYDMCGAASVLGTLQAVAEMGLSMNVVGIIPSCENLPSGRATKPGDIVTSMSGQTIEILNTDAEGRLILCDALTYAKKFKPDAVIDIATLTGACVIALGHVASGLFSNQQKLADEILAAGVKAFDRAWQLPLWEDYQSQLDSNFADMQNIGGRAGGTITAACFLSRFTKDYHWAHLDIAGTAWRSGKDKGSTGRPVPLLTQFLVARAQGRK